MKTITASEARTNLYKLLDETAVTSEPLQLTGKRAAARLVSMDDRRAIPETPHLLSRPGLRASRRRGRGEHRTRCCCLRGPYLRQGDRWVRVLRRRDSRRLPYHLLPR